MIICNKRTQYLISKIDGLIKVGKKDDKSDCADLDACYLASDLFYRWQFGLVKKNLVARPPIK